MPQCCLDMPRDVSGRTGLLGVGLTPHTLVRHKHKLPKQKLLISNYFIGPHGEIFVVQLHTDDDATTGF